MPTVLLIMGWRFFFYANEGDEPIHIHCRKAEKEAKYWLDTKNFDVLEAFTIKMNNKDIRQVKKIIYDHFELIEEEWSNFQKERNK